MYSYHFVVNFKGNYTRIGYYLYEYQGATVKFTAVNGLLIFRNLTLYSLINPPSSLTQWGFLPCEPYLPG